ncbi:MAG: lipocalin-like domain-containing protein [Syntrophorhabdales bacterium]
MVKDNFVGVWRLVASEVKVSDGGTICPYGRDVVGMLIYDGHGHVSVQIMNPDRPLFVSGDIRNGTPEEIKAAFDGYTGYFGNYEVDEQEGTVTHHVMGCPFPNWVGHDQKRFFEFSGNRLTLKTPPTPAAGTIVTAILVWEREA